MLLILSGIFFLLLQQISCDPHIKFVIFRTGTETPEQLALLPRIAAFAAYYGDEKVEEFSLPDQQSATYQSRNEEKLHSTWYKMEITRAILAETPQVSWILTFELSALPTDDSAAIDFSALIAQNPSVSVFLKRSGSGFVMSMYRNDQATRTVVDNIWGKRSSSVSVASAYSSYAFWHPSILSKIKFL